MPKPSVSASNVRQIEEVTMHPFVSGSKMFTAEELECPGRAALLSIRHFNSVRAKTMQNRCEELKEEGFTDARPPENKHKHRLQLLRTALADPAVPEDLRGIIRNFLPEHNDQAQG